MKNDKREKEEPRAQHQRTVDTGNVGGGLGDCENRNGGDVKMISSFFQVSLSPSCPRLLRRGVYAGEREITVTIHCVSMPAVSRTAAAAAALHAVVG